MSQKTVADRILSKKRIDKVFLSCLLNCVQFRKVCAVYINIFQVSAFFHTPLHIPHAYFLPFFPADDTTWFSFKYILDLFMSCLYGAFDFYSSSGCTKGICDMLNKIWQTAWSYIEQKLKSVWRYRGKISQPLMLLFFHMILFKSLSCLSVFSYFQSKNGVGKSL